MSYDQVHDQLYIGDIESARSDSKQDFDAVVTVCQDSVGDNISDDLEYSYFCMADGPNGQAEGRHDYSIFKDAADQILEHLENGDTVLTHCHLGVSRSSATSIAALSVYEEVCYPDMEMSVREQRPQVNPQQELRDHAIRYIEENTDLDPMTPFYHQEE